VPTLADLAGYAVDPPYDDPRMGISLLPLILDEKKQPYLNRDKVEGKTYRSTINCGIIESFL
jgi:hypothetical protein